MLLALKCESSKDTTNQDDKGVYATNRVATPEECTIIQES